MDKLSEMNVFVAVAEACSFSGAARSLKLSPSAVSKQVTRLENRLATRLFNRTTRQVKLTESGQVYFQRCVEILAQVEDAEGMLAGFSSEPRGVLTVSCTADFAKYCLLPIMPLFSARYPNLTFNLRVSGASVDLLAEEVDVAVRMGRLKDSSLIARKLCASRRVICASPDYFSTHGKPQSLEDLHDHNCLTMSSAPAFNHWALSTSLGRQTIEVNGNFVADKIDVLHQHALQGGGLVRLAEFMVESDINEGRLVSVLDDCNDEVQDIHAVYLHRLHVPAKVQAFIEFLLTHLPIPCL